jgi:hypothetical protein
LDFALAQKPPNIKSAMNTNFLQEVPNLKSQIPNEKSGFILENEGFTQPKHPVIW